MVKRNIDYLMCKRGVYYLTRHVPNDLQRHYETPRIVICLKIRNHASALRASRSMAAKLDDYYDVAEDLVDHIKYIFRRDEHLLENDDD